MVSSCLDVFFISNAEILQMGVSLRLLHGSMKLTNLAYEEGLIYRPKQLN